MLPLITGSILPAIGTAVVGAVVNRATAAIGTAVNNIGAGPMPSDEDGEEEFEEEEEEPEEMEALPVRTPRGRELE